MNNPIVKIEDGKAVADSRDVAEYFEKDHSSVLKSIDAIVRHLPDGGQVDFDATSFVHPQNGQTYRYVTMTRDGFTLLAMGFTGKKARPLNIQE